MKRTGAAKVIAPLTIGDPVADDRALVERIVDLEFELEVVRQPPSAPPTSSDTGRL